MSAMASQITSNTIVYSTVYSRRRSSTPHVIGLCEGNSPVTGEFPAQMASNAKMRLFDDVTMTFQTDTYAEIVALCMITWNCVKTSFITIVCETLINIMRYIDLPC